MKKKIIAAGIGVVAMTASGCAVPGVTEAVTERVVDEVAPKSRPYTPPQVDGDARYIAFVEDEGVVTSGGHALSIGKYTCSQFDSVGYEQNARNLISANSESGAGMTTTQLAAIAVGASRYLCPEHEAGLQSHAANR